MSIIPLVKSLPLLIFGCSLFAAGCHAQTAAQTRPAPQPVQVDGTVLEPFAVGSHWNEQKHYGLARKAGIQWLRIDINWYHVQPDNREQWNWEPIDSAMEEAKKQNLKLLAIVGYTNPWASSDPTPEKNNKYAPLTEYDEAWATFVEKVVNRYKDKVAAWEIWNEPDHGGFLKVGPGCWAVQNYPTETPEMQKRLEYRHLIDMAMEKMTAAGVTVTNSGFARGGRSFDDGFVEWLKAQKGDDGKSWMNQFDIINYHAYGWPKFNQLVSRTDEFRQLSQVGDKKRPLWITEHGITQLNVPDEQTKSYLIKSYAVALSQPSVEKLFWFRLTPGGDHMVLIDAKGKPTAAYEAYQVMTQNWEQPVSIEAWKARGQAADAVQGAVATLASGKKVAILWSEAADNNAPGVKMNQLGVKVAALCDQNGASIPVEQNPALSNAPLFVTLD